MVMVRLPTPESSTSGPCSEWELALHALFDGELDAVDSFKCEQHLEQCQRCSIEVKNLKSMRRRITRSAMTWRAPSALRNRIG
jgi:anti-sigma factor RsiW